MKKMLTAASICLFMMACEKTETETITRTETLNLDSSLIAYYPFNGNANDTSGNNQHGVLLNGTTFGTNAQNLSNKAADFDGIDDYIRITDQSSYFARDKMTFAFQVYLRNTNVRSSLFSKTGWNTPSGVVYGIGISQNNAPWLEWTVADPIDCSTNWIYNTHSFTLSTFPIQSNRWYHVALVYNYGLEIMYINGQYNNARVSNYSSLKRCSGSDLKIGGWWKDDIVSIQGKMDEFRVYDRVLAENEIVELASEIN